MAVPPEVMLWKMLVDFSVLFLSLYWTTLVSSVFACRPYFLVLIISSSWFLFCTWCSELGSWSLASPGIFCVHVHIDKSVGVFCNWGMTEPRQKRFKTHLFLVFLVCCWDQVSSFCISFQSWGTGSASISMVQGILSSVLHSYSVDCERCAVAEMHNGCTLVKFLKQTSSIFGKV